MLRLRNAITITQVSTDTRIRNKVLYFPFVTDVEVVKSFENQTQTAFIRLPRNLKYQDKNIYAGTDPLFLRGDKIKIEAGYYPNLTTRFEGYISKIGNNIPVEIKCEDEMFLLKQVTSPVLSYSEVSLDTLLKEMIGTTVKYANIKASLGRVRIHKASISDVLYKLRSEYGIYSFFQDGILKVGTPFYEPKKRATFLFERQIIEHSLDYLRSEDVRIQVKGVLIDKNGVKTEKYYGPKEGDLRTVTQYGGTIEGLDRLAEDKLSTLTYTGYYGSFTTLLEPAVEPGDYAIINSYKMPERNGTYLIKSVETKLSTSGGGRQKIELERRIL
jgi:hypothetical protein